MPGRHTAATREAAALELARGLTLQAAASSAGVNVRTIRRWKLEPAFAARIAEIRAELTDRTVGLLTEGRLAAVSTATKLLKSSDEAIRIRAVRALLLHGERAAGASTADYADLDRYLASR